jgi:hypothetical protein
MDLVHEAGEHVAGPEDAPWLFMLRIINMERWPAVDLEAEARFADGTRVREVREQLDPWSVPGGDGDSWLMALREVTEEWLPPSASQPMEVVLRYSDVKGLARYEQTLRVRLTRHRSVQPPYADFDADQPIKRRLR